MKKIILIGRSGSGKTTLIRALRGEKIHYHKTQYVNHFDVIIDTPGEYAETKNLGAALAMYTFEAQVVGLLASATEPYSLFSPCITPLPTGRSSALSPKSTRRTPPPAGRSNGSGWPAVPQFIASAPIREKASAIF